MSSKAITQPPSGQRPGGRWQDSSEAAPSVMRTDDPTVARVIGMTGAALIVLGGLSLMLNRTGRASPIGSGWASFFLAAGVAGLLFHAAFDWDVQFRRVYMAFGYLAMAVGAFLCFLPYPQKAGDMFGAGFLCLGLGLFFVLAFLRNETDAWLRQLAEIVVGAAGLVMAVVGLFGGSIKGDFLLPYGLLLALLGLGYLTAFVVLRGVSDDWGYRGGLAIGAGGALAFLVALGRSMPAAFYRWGWLSDRPAEYLIPSGILLMALGVLYGAVSLGLCSDNRLVVLTRRELGAQFYSPIAYIVLFAYIIAHWLAYFLYLVRILEGGAVPEPIVSGFILQWSAVIATLFIIPVLTMRLLSEEKRTGTLEVLLTAPVNEGAVVTSKFLAAFIMFLVIWVPFGLFLVALRVDGGQPFDYRPLLSFFVGLCITGAGFVAMGVFFSSLTRNQIASGVLTFAGMLALTLVFLFQGAARGTAWTTALKHMSYIDIWIDTLDGRLIPMNLLFFVSLAVLGLFLSVKVLEARKWA